MVELRNGFSSGLCIAAQFGEDHARMEMKMILMMSTKE